MRTVLFAVVVFLVTWAGLGTVEAKESEEARIRARVREYTAPSSAPFRRDLIVRELAEADTGAATRIVREAALSESRRAGAMDLAARMRLRGVWDLAKRWCDGAFEPVALRLAAEAPEEEAGRWLVDRWAAAPPESERARRALDAMSSARLGPGAVEALGACLGDAVRAAAAFALLRDQMGIDDTCPADLKARWPEALARHRDEAREFAADGDDLLASPGVRLRDARRVGRNFRLAPARWIDVAPLPPDVQVATGVLRVRVRPGAGEGAFISLACDGGTVDLRLRGDGSAWFLVEGPPREGARVEAPLRAGEWQSIEFRVTDPAIRAAPQARDVRVYVDGREMRPSGGFWRLPTSPASLSIGAATTGDATVVGGVSWRRDAK